MDVFQDFVQRYEAAVKHEQRVRDAAFICDFEMIGNVKVYALTPKLFSILTLAKSPFVVGGSVAVEQILSFLWTIKPKKEGETYEEWCQTVVFENNVKDTLKEIDLYLDTSFQDIPGSKDDSGVPYYSSQASIVDTFASEYGWTEDVILNTPYKRLWQYLRVILKRTNPKKTFFNASDSIKSEFMKQIQPKT